MPLRLKSLELYGYKTFATRTVFEFAAGITAIVGPNGSGKSNIADSLRWVLGEQSYTLLRGKKTEDMIFSGSEHRPRAGMASAEILFDNTTGWLPVDFSEVAILRRAYRDGHNDYLLNGQVVRLRDMNEVLATSGLSERTYTILGQGLVDASLALKADDRRRLFEEAAGVGLYRFRREEAVKRLENTRHNLERVLDIMSELEPRLKTLERQARRANEYGATQAGLRLLLREWYGFHWHRAQQEFMSTREAVRIQEGKVLEAREAHAQAQAKYTQFRERLGGLRAGLNNDNRRSSELRGQLESVTRDLAVLEERRRALSSSQAASGLEAERSANEEQLALEQYSDVSMEAARLQAEFDEAKNLLLSRQATLQARQSERGTTEEQLLSARAKITSMQTLKAETQARLDDHAARLATQRQKLQAARPFLQDAETALAEAKKAYQVAQEYRTNKAKAVQKSVDEFDSKKKEVEKLEADRRSRLEERVARQAEYSRAQAQLDILLQAEQSLADYADGARFLLEAARQTRLQVHGALSAVLDVPPELEVGISAALGDSLDAVLLQGTQIEDALVLLESNEAGRTALLAIDGKANRAIDKPDDSGCLGLASELVKAPLELRPAVVLLLGATLMVRDRAAARRLLPNIPVHGRVVTLRGEVFRGDGLIIAGKPAPASTLSRPRIKRELSSSLTNFKDRLDHLNEMIEKLTTDLSSALQEQSGREEELGKVRAEFEQAQSSEQKAAVEHETAVRQFDWLQVQRQELQTQIELDEKDQVRLQGVAAENETQIVEVQADIHRYTNQMNEITLAEAQEQVAYWNTRLAVTEQALNSVRTLQADRQQTIDRLQAQQQDHDARKIGIERQSGALEVEKGKLQEQERRLHDQIEALRIQIEPAEVDLDSAEAQENTLQEHEANAQRSLVNAERTFGQLQLDQTRKQEALDSLQQRITDDFGLVSYDYAENVEGPVPLPFEGLVEQLPITLELTPALEEHLTQQRAQLRRMGPVNPEAKREYDSESERFSFMSTQVKDLQQAETDLRQVIVELDQLTRQEFSRTYEAVDKQFRAIFTRLFGGGSAHLTLTDPDNLVETGIEIEARLPGRREQGLSLLSGGERSLTAIALVFALLKVSPTPVCVMDEVDAMLDEANVGRFRDLLMDLSKETQFIIITHNRNTVQAADVIYGITMGRDSASQIISLKLDEVGDEILGTNRT
jgi:chromosome segregation protein